MEPFNVNDATDKTSKPIDHAFERPSAVVGRGDLRTIRKPFELSEIEAEKVEFRAGFPPAPREPRGSAARIRRVIRRVRRAA